jgi:hypothetical protein
MFSAIASARLQQTRLAGRFRSSQSVGYSRKLPISFPDLRTAVHSCALNSVQTFRSVYYPLPFLPRKLPDRGRAILLQQTTQFS